MSEKAQKLNQNIIGWPNARKGDGSNDQKRLLEKDDPRVIAPIALTKCTTMDQLSTPPLYGLKIMVDSANCKILLTRL